MKKKERSLPAKLPTFRERQVATTLDNKRRYIKALAKLGSPRQARKAADVGRRTIIRYRASDPEFVRQEAGAYEDYKNRLEEEADRRAVDGFLEPVFQQGELVGHKRKFSDGLLALRLKRLDPEYRDKGQGGSAGAGTTQINIYLPDNGRAASEDDLVDVTPTAVELPKVGEPPD